jgi:hypothetical protein
VSSDVEGPNSNLHEPFPPTSGEARRLLPGKPDSADPTGLALWSLAERVRTSLIPIEPSSAFVDELRRSLTQTAAPMVEVFSPWRYSWIIGATAVGSALSLLGLLQLLRGSRRSFKRAS